MGELIYPFGAILNTLLTIREEDRPVKPEAVVSSSKNDGGEPVASSPLALLPSFADRYTYPLKAQGTKPFTEPRPEERRGRRCEQVAIGT